MFSLSSVLTALKPNSHKEETSQEMSSINDKKSNDIPKISNERSQGEKKPSPCCCCKETKQTRDAW